MIHHQMKVMTVKMMVGMERLKSILQKVIGRKCQKL